MKHGSNPGLSIVSDESLPDPGTVEAPKTAPRREGAIGERGGRLVAVLSLVILLVGLLAVQQYRQVVSLQARVESLNGQLATAQAQLADYQSHLREIRGGVADVGARMEALRALVEQDPTAPARPRTQGEEPPQPSAESASAAGN
jgi:hypothetical protein